MANFIEEFYYGNLDPQARSTKENKMVQKQMEVLMLNEDFLTGLIQADKNKGYPPKAIAKPRWYRFGN